MKNRYVILISSLLFSLFVAESNAQSIRVEASVGDFMNDRYSSIEWSFGVAYERFLTSNLSLSTGATLKILEDPLTKMSYDMGILSDYSQKYGHNTYFIRATVPLLAEYKYLISNRVRAYLNAGLLFNANFGDELGSPYEGSLTTDIHNFNMGIGAGAGVEFGLFRVGIIYDTDITSLGKIEGENIRAKNTVAAMAGLRFGGKKLLRKSSKATAALVNLPIDESSVKKNDNTAVIAKSSTASTTKSVAAAQGSTESVAEAVESTPISYKSAPFGWMQNFGIAIGTDTYFEDLELPTFAITYEHRVKQYLSLTTAVMYRQVGSPLNGYYQDYISIYDNDYAYRTIERVSVPINIEYKYPLHDNIRVYANAGVMLNWNLSVYGEDYFTMQDGTWETLNPYKEELKGFCIGGGIGGGVEFYNVRIGIQYDQDFMSITNFKTDPYVSTATIMLGYRFGGNKLYRRKSKVEQKSVTFPILEQ